MRDDGLHTANDAVQVDVHHLGVTIDRGLLDHPVAADTSVVDEDVDAALGVEHFGHGPIHRLGVGDVAHHRGDFDAGFRSHGGELLALVEAAHRAVDLPAFGREIDSSGTADP